MARKPWQRRELRWRREQCGDLGEPWAALRGLASSGADGGEGRNLPEETGWQLGMVMASG